jgi:hypothetical protein
MKKKQLFLAATAILLASCTDTTYLGDQAAITNGSGVISFGSSSPAVTRAESYGSEAAEKLEYKFKVFGVKTMGTGTDQRVFATNADGVAPYDVWFVNGSSNSTASNSSNWEYVGITGSSTDPVTTYGTTGYKVTLTADQTIKYWDYSATAYNFQAWSDINPTDKVTISAIDKNTMTITGTPTQLANFWISDLQTGAPASFTSKVVQFTFRKAATKVRLGIYETVPGYVVKNVIFSYTDGTVKTSPVDPTSTTEKAYAYLDGKFVGTSSDSKTLGVTYDATTNRAILTPTDATSNTTYFNFGEFSRGAIGESSTDPTWAYTTSTTDPYTSVMPNTTAGNIADMTLKVDYELYNDKSGETIKITGATAVVPAAYMTWKPNYAYTYLFKITDDKLTPITLDAVVIEDGEGKQETITTVTDVTDPSITTYQNGSNVTATNEYTAGKPIYVVVTGQTLTSANAKLYTASADAGYPGGITEASVANALANGTPNSTTDPTSWSVTEDTKTLTITAASGLTPVSTIPAADSPTGVELTINGAYFTPTAPVSPATINYYVFQYVKVAPVAGVPAYYTAVTGGTILASGTTYFTFDGTNYASVDGDGSTTAGTTYYTRSGDGTTTPYTYAAVTGALTTGDPYYTFDGSAFSSTAYIAQDGDASGTSYYTYTAAVPAVEGEYVYKVIKVQ